MVSQWNFHFTHFHSLLVCVCVPAVVTGVLCPVPQTPPPLEPSCPERNVCECVCGKHHKKTFTEEMFGKVFEIELN